VLAYAPELFALAKVFRNDPAIREPPEHDERVIPPTTETLRTSQQLHRLGVVSRSLLESEPCEIVRTFVLTSIDGRLRVEATGAGRGALRRRGLRLYGDEEEKERNDHEQPGGPATKRDCLTSRTETRRD
jgi:hypothetical protein